MRAEGPHGAAKYRIVSHDGHRFSSGLHTRRICVLLHRCSALDGCSRVGKSVWLCGCDPPSHSATKIAPALHAVSKFFSVLSPTFELRFALKWKYSRACSQSSTSAKFRPSLSLPIPVAQHSLLVPPLSLSSVLFPVAPLQVGMLFFFVFVFFYHFPFFFTLFIFF